MSNEEKIRVLREALQEARGEVSKRLSEIPPNVHHHDERRYCRITLDRIDGVLHSTKD